MCVRYIFDHRIIYYLYTKTCILEELVQKDLSVTACVPIRPKK